jgi:hypothetical protein
MRDYSKLRCQFIKKEEVREISEEFLAAPRDRAVSGQLRSKVVFELHRVVL